MQRNNHILIICDGMDDSPLTELNGQTPREFAHTPNIDSLIAQFGKSSMLTVPQNHEAASDVAILTILGQNIEHHTGRAALEALGHGITLNENQIAWRCNLITTDSQGTISENAGNISSGEAKILTETLNSAFIHKGITFTHCTANKSLMIMPENADTIMSIEKYAAGLLAKHPINIRRITKGLFPANAIQLWSASRAEKLKPFPINGAVIAGVNLVKGIGRSLCLDVINVDGADGKINTNYKGKGAAAIAAAEKYDFVMVHIESCDEASHQKNINDKIHAIEQIDKHIIGPIIQHLPSAKIAIMADHPTSVLTGKHLALPVEIFTNYTLDHNAVFGPDNDFINRFLNRLN